MLSDTTASSRRSPRYDILLDRLSVRDSLLTLTVPFNAKERSDSDTCYRYNCPEEFRVDTSAGVPDQGEVIFEVGTDGQAEEA